MSEHHTCGNDQHTVTYAEAKSASANVAGTLLSFTNSVFNNQTGTAIIIESTTAPLALNNGDTSNVVSGQVNTIFAGSTIYFHNTLHDPPNSIGNNAIINVILSGTQITASSHIFNKAN
jgi:hypothetical protein